MKKSFFAIVTIFSIAVLLLLTSCVSNNAGNNKRGASPGPSLTGMTSSPDKNLAKGPTTSGTQGTTIAPGISGTPGTSTPRAATHATPSAPSSSDAAFRFVVMGDSRGTDKGINSKVIKQTMERIKHLSPQPDFAVMPGDLVDGAKTYEGVKAQLEYFKKTVTSYYPETFFYPGLGNHETAGGSGGEKVFGEVFPGFKATFLEGYGRTVYYFDRGQTRFFMLNTDHPGELHSVSDKQLDWVKANRTAKGGNIFFMHEPPFPTGANIGFSLDKNPPQRSKLWSIVDSSDRPVVFCSHEHNYTRRHIDSAFNTTINGTGFKFSNTVYQITTGGFGAPLYPQYESKKNVDVPPVVTNNFVVVDITGKKITVTAYDINGKELDTFSQW